MREFPGPERDPLKFTFLKKALPFEASAFPPLADSLQGCRAFFFPSRSFMGAKKGVPLHSVEERRLRALMMLEYRVKNAASFKEVAREFNVSAKTVARTLTWARKAGLVAKAEDKILQELVPLAHEAIKQALTQTNDVELAAKTALEIFKGTVPGFTKTKPGSNLPSGAGATSELESYIAELRGSAGILDGEVEPSPRRALPAATPQLAAEGLHESNRGNPDGDDAAAQGSQGVGATERQGTPDNDEG